MSQNLIKFEKSYAEMLPSLFQGAFLEKFSTQETDIASQIIKDFKRASFISLDGKINDILESCLKAIPPNATEAYQDVPNYTQGDLEARLFPEMAFTALKLLDPKHYASPNSVSISYFDPLTKQLCAININLIERPNKEKIWCISHLKNIRAPYEERQWLILYSISLLEKLNIEDTAFLNLPILKTQPPTIAEQEIFAILKSHIPSEAVSSLIAPIFASEHPVSEIEKLKQRIIHKQNLDCRDLKIRQLHNLFEKFPDTLIANEIFSRTKAELEFFYEEVLSQTEPPTHTYIQNLKKIYQALQTKFNDKELLAYQWAIHIELALFIYSTFTDSETTILTPLVSSLEKYVENLRQLSITPNLPQFLTESLSPSYFEIVRNITTEYKELKKYEPTISSSSQLNLAADFFKARKNYTNFIQEQLLAVMKQIERMHKLYEQLLKHLFLEKIYFSTHSEEGDDCYQSTIQSINETLKITKQTLEETKSTHLQHNLKFNDAYLIHINYFGLKKATEEQVMHWENIFNNQKIKILEKYNQNTSLIENHKQNCANLCYFIKQFKKDCSDIIESYLKANRALGLPTQDLDTALRPVNQFLQKLDQELEYFHPNRVKETYLVKQIEKLNLKTGIEALTNTQLMQCLEDQFIRWNASIDSTIVARQTDFDSFIRNADLIALVAFLNKLEKYQNEWFRLNREIFETCSSIEKKLNRPLALQEKSTALNQKIQALMISNLSQHIDIVDKCGKSFLNRNTFGLIMISLSAIFMSLALCFLNAAAVYLSISMVIPIILILSLSIIRNEQYHTQLITKELPIIQDKLSLSFFQATPEKSLPIMMPANTSTI
jgi:hypothetical protein